jgi:hypothetical protein
MKTTLESSHDNKITGIIIYGLLSLWFVFSLTMTLQGRFNTGPQKPPIALGLTMLAPMIAFIVAYRRRGAIWAFCQTLDLRLITAVHIWRLIGIDFILAWTEGRLPAGFALPAGIGDALTALAAIPLALGLNHGLPAARKRFIVWNLFGFSDLVLAVALGVLHSNSPIGIFSAYGSTSPLMGEFPRALIPTFLVPVYMLLHLLALARRHEIAAPIQTD